jgi:hypothetical protein
MINDFACADRVVQKRCDLNAIRSDDRKTGQPIDFQRRVEQTPDSFQWFTRPQTLNLATDPKLLFHTQSQFVLTRE